MKNESRERQPARVPRPVGAKQAGEVRARWAWTEPAVWTDRMLTPLEQGVKGGVWFSLIDKVYSLPNLQAAFAKVKANGGPAGCDHQTIAMYAADLETNLRDLSDQLRNGTYRPQRIRRVYIPKLGSRERRPLGIPPIRDRVVQMAAHPVLAPIFEADPLPQQYGFRPGVDAKMVIRRVFFHITDHGRREIVDGDLSDCFGTIPHGPLLRCLARRVSDGQVLSVVRQWLRTPVVEREGRHYRRTTEARDSRRGVPQGGCSALPLCAQRDPTTPLRPQKSRQCHSILTPFPSTVRRRSRPEYTVAKRLCRPQSGAADRKAALPALDETSAAPL